MLDESTIEGLTDEDTLTEVAVSRLVDDILAGTLAPGQKLLIAKLRQTYQMGATPLREALSRLCSLGFVRNETRRGFRVTPVSLADLRDITLVRTTIETAALRQAIELGDDEWEVGLIAAFARLERTAQRLGTETQQSEGAYEPAHKAFHTALLAGCGSPGYLTCIASTTIRRSGTACSPCAVWLAQRIL
ncbi:GntR family transcriptional regulator [Cupriavidus sp. D39]|nr:GntR family transcriptional regulator [Cupriavidus sp. D39]MCY0855771.1 GntR family transcriptional regulator [Cupriavidus sp. D39]